MTLRLPTAEEVIENTRRLQHGQHLTLDGDAFVCAICGVRETPTLPLPLPDYLAQMDAVMRVHLDCNPEARL